MAEKNEKSCAVSDEGIVLRCLHPSNSVKKIEEAHVASRQVDDETWTVCTRISVHPETARCRLAKQSPRTRLGEFQSGARNTSFNNLQSLSF